jgi:hypothetical protein
VLQIHLRVLNHQPADNVIHRWLDKAEGYPFQASVAFPVVGNERAVSFLASNVAAGVETD